MEKFPQTDNNNDQRDGFVVGESGEAVPAEFKSASLERSGNLLKTLEEKTGMKIEKRKQFTGKVSAEHIRRLPEDAVLRPIEKGPSIKFLKEGDLVQWKNASADQWEKPRKIKGFSEDGMFAFFEESKTGIPTEELHPWDQKE